MDQSFMQGRCSVSGLIFTRLYHSAPLIITLATTPSLGKTSLKLNYVIRHIQFWHLKRCGSTSEKYMVIMALKTNSDSSSFTQFIKLKGNFETIPKEDRSFTIDEAPLIKY